MTLATIVLAGATVYAKHDERRYATNNAGLAKSFEADASEWRDDPRVRAIEVTDCIVGPRGTLCGTAMSLDEPLFGLDH